MNEDLKEAVETIRNALDDYSSCEDGINWQRAEDAQHALDQLINEVQNGRSSN